MIWRGKTKFSAIVTKLGVDQIDLLLLHQPMPPHFERRIEAYQALETLLADGRVRAIGVSNFMPHHLAALGQRGGPDPDTQDPSSWDLTIPEA